MIISCICGGFIESVCLLAISGIAALLADCCCRARNAKECFRSRYPGDDTGDSCECYCHVEDGEDESDAYSN